MLCLYSVLHLGFVFYSHVMIPSGMCLIGPKSYYHSSIGFVICQRKAPYRIRSVLNCVNVFNRSHQFLSVRGAKAVRVSYHVAISKSLPQLIAITDTVQEEPREAQDGP